MLSCGTLERRNSPYKEVIVEPFVSKSQSEIFARGFDWEGNPVKGLGNGKKHP